MGTPLLCLATFYCAVFWAVAVWIGLMLFTHQSGRERWSEGFQNRLRHELGAVQGGRRGTDMDGG